MRIIPSIKILGRIVCGIPPVSLVLLYAFVIRIRLNIGHWPSYGNPDPAQSPFFIHDIAATIGLIIALLSPLGIICLWSLYLLDEKHKCKREMFRATILFVVLYSFWFVLLFFDPGNYLDWILD